MHPFPNTPSWGGFQFKKVHGQLNSSTFPFYHMYISPTQTRTVTCYVTDLSSRQGGRPTTDKTATVSTTARIWSWVPEGIKARTGWLTVSCKVFVPSQPSGLLASLTYKQTDGTHRLNSDTTTADPWSGVRISRI